jgi:hypothetical protein
MERSLSQSLQRGIDEVEQIDDESVSIRLTNLKEVHRLHNLWIKQLPSVRPFYGEYRSLLRNMFLSTDQP